ncbi:vacuolar protein-sorting-associated protein 25-like [Tubulanus polymorphus]|uniref:vacuolar protein-sorting-associated protein 25-like n=1 Tax=Tubulanus polymorphus TaxID=672921 RepID=UPI003DA3CF95
MAAVFEWPWQYNFPPFFTVQPNAETRKKQIEAWCNLILEYYRKNKLFNLDVKESQNDPIFYNKKIDRKLNLDAIQAILEELQKKGNVEWTDKRKEQCLVMWRSPEEWGKIMYQWAQSNAMMNTVCTFYELTQGDDTVNQEFYGIEDWLLIRALKTLEEQRKAEVIGDEGVKFF